MSLSQHQHSLNPHAMEFLPGQETYSSVSATELTWEERIMLARSEAVIPSFTEGDFPACYENQLQTVRKILSPQESLESDCKSRSTILCQQMMSGKTGTYLVYAVTMLLTNGPDEDKLVDNVVILTAFSDNNLKAQIKRDLEELVKRLDCSARRKTRILGSVKVYHLGDLPREGKNIENAITPNTLIIHDECHVGQSNLQTIQKCFSEAGIEKVFLGDCSQLREKNIWYLAVSATPFSELASNDLFNQQKSIVMGKTSDAYIGVGKLIERGHVEYYDVRERSEFLRAKINLHNCGEPGWIIIRAANRSSAGRNSAYEDTIAAATAVGLPIKEHNCQVNETERREWYDEEDLTAGSDNTGPGVVPTPNFLKKPPISGNTTVVLITGAFRMGANLPKQHIKAVFDTTMKSSCDTVLQGLLGRSCGHWEPAPEFRVYLSESTRDSVENYAMRFSESAQPSAPERMLDGRAMNVSSGETTSNKQFTSDSGVQYVKSIDNKVYRSFPPIKFEPHEWEQYSVDSEIYTIHNILNLDYQIPLEYNEKYQNYHTKTSHSSSGLEWSSHVLFEKIRNRISHQGSPLVRKHDLTRGMYEGFEEKLEKAAEEGINCGSTAGRDIYTHTSQEIGDISLLLFHNPHSNIRYLAGTYRMSDVNTWDDVKSKEGWNYNVDERANYHPSTLTQEIPIADSGGQRCPLGEEQLRDLNSFTGYIKQAITFSLTSTEGHGGGTMIPNVVIDPSRWDNPPSLTDFEAILDTKASDIEDPIQSDIEGIRYFKLNRSNESILKFERQLSLGDKVRKVNTDVGETGVVTRVFPETGKVQVSRDTPGRKWNKQSEKNFEILESRFWAYKSISWSRTPV